jgi:glycosyltransferase involved in cell wall biosynthesis
VEIKYGPRPRGDPLGWLPYYRNEKSKISILNKLLIAAYSLLNTHRLLYFLMVSPSVAYDLKRANLKVSRVCSLKGAAVEKVYDAYRTFDKRDIDIIYLASISRHKGVYDVPLILNYVKNRVPNIRAVIIGKVPEHISEYLRNMLKSYGLEDNVRLLGYVDEYEKFELLARSKVMIYPSYMDTFAIVVLEALSTGTPVIAYAIPAIAINYRTNAVIKIRIGNIAAMAEKVIDVLSNEQYWTKLSKEAINFSSTYNWNEIAKSFLMCIVNGLRK